MFWCRCSSANIRKVFHTLRNNSFSTPNSQRGGKVFRNSRYTGQQKRSNKGGQYIDPAKFVNQAVAVAEEVIFEPVNSFNDFGFIQPLAVNVAAKGYETPTPIQDEAIKSVMTGRDLIGLANTGTGKTAAFVLPIIHRLKTQPQRPVLIIAPTRELAAQIDDEFRGFARGLGLYSALCVGGVNLQRQINALSRRPQVIIGTPGRLKDLFNQKALRLDSVGVLVLDEADRMLDMGFIRDIRFLIDQLPTERQTLCFSATITPEIQRLLDDMLTDPVTVSVRKGETSDHVQQDVIKADSKDEKIAILKTLLDKPEFEKVLIFGQTKWSVQRLADTLTKEGTAAQAIHGNKTQPQRQKALNAFKAGQVRILVATDVAARGLDIPNVSHVINFDQPTTYDDYVHRIGRTGRAGKRGHALTFVASR
jgi:ATP-dependent RNA helicase RhlE